MLKMSKLQIIKTAIMICFAVSVFAETNEDIFDTFEEPAVTEEKSVTTANEPVVTEDNDVATTDESIATEEETAITTDESVITEENVIATEKEVVGTTDEPIVETVVPAPIPAPAQISVPTPAPTPAPAPAPAVETADAAPAPASTSKPKIAVYVTGGKDAVENRALGTYILEALVKSGRYIAIERTEAFLAEIANEHVTQRSGAIDDAQISRLGKQSGVQFVCVADITQGLRSNQVSVRILNVETAEVVAVGVSDGRLNTMQDLSRISANVVNAMFGIGAPPEKRLRFGCRVAYNNSFVYNYAYTVRTLNEETFRTHDVDHDNEFGAGSGFEFGFVTAVRVSDNLSVETGANFIWRQPVNITDVVTITELAVSVPAFLRYRVGASPFFMQAGVVLEVPFNAEGKKADGTTFALSDRASFDIGLVAGAGYRFGKFVTADIRIVNGLINFDGDDRKTPLLLQTAAGVSLMF